MDKRDHLTKEVTAFYSGRKNNCINGKSLFVCVLLFIFSCSQPEKDKGIKEMIATAAKEEPAFAGVNYTVRSGVVMLSGSCATQREKDKVNTRITNTAGVKGIVDEIQIQPVTLTSDFSLKQAVDSVLMNYAMVQASAQDSVVTLQGEVENKALPDLLKAINSLQPKGINQQIAAK